MKVLIRQGEPVAVVDDETTERIAAMGQAARCVVREIPEASDVALQWLAQVRERRSKAYEVVVFPMLFINGQPCLSAGDEDLGLYASGATAAEAIAKASSLLPKDGAQ